MVYLLSFLFNTANLEPVILRDCVAVKRGRAASLLSSHVAEVRKMGVNCEKKKSALSYDCVDFKRGLLGKVIVLSDITECKGLPSKAVSDLKKLTNRK